MEERRFFVPPSCISADEVTVSGDEFLHMTRVLRMKPGFKAVVCADDGKERACTIREITRDYAVLNVDRVREVDRKKVSLTLFSGNLKNKKLDFVVQKAVELGVDEVVPFVSAYTAESRYDTARAERIALEAAKQCGSVWLSKVGSVVPFDEVVARFGEFDTVLFAYENERKQPVSKDIVKGNRIALVVGSEGGFKPEEAERAAAAGARTVTLGRRILRAETAGIVGAALTLFAAGELDYD